MNHRQARIPRPGDIEKGQHLGRVDHLRDGKPEAEQNAGDKRHQEPEHDQPIRWRTTNTVTIALAMKVIVATIERGAKRAMPHTPCPLVQPPPSWVPKPTSKPPRINIGQEASMTMASPSPLRPRYKTAP